MLEPFYVPELVSNLVRLVDDVTLCRLRRVNTLFYALSQEEVRKRQTYMKVCICEYLDQRRWLQLMNLNEICAYEINRVLICLYDQPNWSFFIDHILRRCASQPINHHVIYYLILNRVTIKRIRELYPKVTNWNNHITKTVIKLLEEEHLELLGAFQPQSLERKYFKRLFESVIKNYSYMLTFISWCLVYNITSTFFSPYPTAEQIIRCISMKQSHVSTYSIKSLFYDFFKNSNYI